MRATPGFEISTTSITRSRSLFFNLAALLFHDYPRYMKSSFQRGSAQMQNGKWTIRYLVRDPNSPKGWRHKRETLPDCKSEKQAQRVLSERLAGVNSFNNNPRSMMRAVTLGEFEQTTW